MALYREIVREKVCKREIAKTTSTTTICIKNCDFVHVTSRRNETDACTPEDTNF